jgi:hypothetical protein
MESATSISKNGNSSPFSVDKCRPVSTGVDKANQSTILMYNVELHKTRYTCQCRPVSGSVDQSPGKCQPVSKNVDKCRQASISAGRAPKMKPRSPEATGHLRTDTGNMRGAPLQTSGNTPQLCLHISSGIDTVA